MLYGMAEGGLHSRYLRRALVEAGFQATTPDMADIIIAHSAGSFLIPKDTKATLFIHINGPYWRTRTFPDSLREKLIGDWQIRRQKGELRHWLLSGATNTFYMANLRHGLSLRKPYYNLDDAIKQLPGGKQHKHIFIRNQHDSYSEDIQLAQHADPSYALISLPGNHDDCWRNPEPYVDIIQSLHHVR
jgi:hypothetical protein